jgi:hypothetical protein
MSGTNPSPEFTPQSPGTGESVSAQKKTRSPAERAIVWGAIAVGALLIATEGWPRLRYSLDFHALDDAVISQDAENTGIVESKAKELVTRYTSHQTQANLPSNELASPRVDTYTYTGLISERKFYVYYGHHRGNEEPEVLAVRTEPVEFVYATMPEDDLQPQTLDTTPVEQATK